METMQTQHLKRVTTPFWAKDLDRLRSAAKFTSIAQRILVLGLIATLIGTVVGHFTPLPNFRLRWPVIFFIAAWVGVEIRWKCLSAYCVGAIRAGWMKKRSVLVEAFCKMGTETDHIRALTEGKSWLTPVREATDSVLGQIKTLLASVNDLDEGFRRLDVGTGPFLAVGCSEAVTMLPKIWERFSVILPGRLRREAFDPAFNDMLEEYMRAQKFLGNGGRRWLGFGFTLCAVLIVMDCIRVMLTSGASRFLLGIFPESFRAWWRRQ